MSIWYNPPKDSPFSSVGIQDWDAINSTIHCEELRFISDDEFYYLFFFASKFTDLVKVGDKDWHFQPMLFTLQVAKVPTYKAYDYKQKKEVEKTQSFVEKLVCYALDSLDPAKAYKGFFVLQKSGAIELALSGKDAEGNPMPELVRNQLLDTAFKFEEVEPTLVPADEVKVKSKYSGRSGMKLQTEMEKLNDRFQWVLNQIKVVMPDEEIKTLADVIKLAKGDPQIQEMIEYFALYLK